MCEITDTFYLHMDDTKLWGPKKAFLYLALAAGVKGTEEDSIYKFICRFIQNQVPGKDEQTILSLSHILYYWLFPFSDSKQLSNLDPTSYCHCATIISKLMTNLVVRSGIPPQEWTSSDISREITDHLRITFQNSDQFEYIIPVLKAFFSFLSEKQLQSQAKEIFQDLSKLPLLEGKEF
ncbi:MAG: hypothetical protein CVV33_08030 [Methanomicrobiales archaeon HGW-Methanomicrobiales-4]|nr:MAG: hypothetical protein CVV33_08030 [Methanomicrobiales archaeon HGW-Methanomicrobiales-4]